MYAVYYFLSIFVYLQQFLQFTVYTVYGICAVYI